MDQCIIDAVGGNEEALKNLYDHYSLDMFKFAMSIVKRYDLAEDVVQDVFVNLMVYGRNCKVKRPKSWLFTIVRNQALKVLKDEHYDRNVSLEEQPVTSEENGVEDYINNSLENIEAIKCLDETELQIITLCVYSGCTQREAGMILGLPYMKVRAKSNYAMKKLRKFYIDRGDSCD